MHSEIQKVEMTIINYLQSLHLEKRTLQHGHVSPLVSM